MTIPFIKNYIFFSNEPFLLTDCEHLSSWYSAEDGLRYNSFVSSFGLFRTYLVDINIPSINSQCESNIGSR